MLIRARTTHRICSQSHTHTQFVWYTATQLHLQSACKTLIAFFGVEVFISIGQFITFFLCRRRCRTHVRAAVYACCQFNFNFVNRPFDHHHSLPIWIVLCQLCKIRSLFCCLAAISHKITHTHRELGLQSVSHKLPDMQLWHMWISDAVRQWLIDFYRMPPLWWCCCMCVNLETEQTMLMRLGILATINYASRERVDGTFVRCSCIENRFLTNLHFIYKNTEEMKNKPLYMWQLGILNNKLLLMTEYCKINECVLERIYRLHEKWYQLAQQSTENNYGKSYADFSINSGG